MTSQLDTASPKTQNFIASTHNLFIGGEWISPIKHSPEPIIDPSTGEQIGEFASASPSDMQFAIQSARQAFDEGEWRSFTPAQRAKLLLKVADLIDAHRSVLGELESLDGGKPIDAATYGEVAAAAEAFRYHAGWCTKIKGSTIQIVI